MSYDTVTYVAFGLVVAAFLLYQLMEHIYWKKSSSKLNGNTRRLVLSVLVFVGGVVFGNLFGVNLFGEQILTAVLILAGLAVAFGVLTAVLLKYAPSWIENGTKITPLHFYIGFLTAFGFFLGVFTITQYGRLFTF